MLREMVRFAITPRDFPGKEWEIVGWFSAPEQRTDVLLILLHGGTYTHAYWDMPYKPEVYSCVQWMYELGIATLNVDRLGNGESSFPPGKDLTIPVNADSVDQLIAQIRRDGLQGQRFSKIVTVGHSLGSLIASCAQAKYDSADGVVLTGITGANVLGLTPAPESIDHIMRIGQPARSLPHFADQLDRIDDHYYAMSSDWRKRQFFRIPPVEPEMVEHDLRLQGFQTLGEYETCWIGFEVSKDIKGPVLVELGEFDTFFYDPETEPDISTVHAKASEKNPPNFTMAPLFRNTGHNLTQHPNAHEHYEVLVDWLRANNLV